MKAVIQRVSQAGITIDGEKGATIGPGFVVLLGIENEDEENDVQWLSKKIVQMRIFSDKEGLMNLSLQDIEGEILLVSQFTLHAATRKGNRPSFMKAARPDKAIPLYEKMIAQLNMDLGKPVETGKFGADMQIALVNDGPVTIIIDSKEL